MRIYVYAFDMYHRKNNKRTTLATKMSEAYDLNNIVTEIGSVGTFRAGFHDRVEDTSFSATSGKRWQVSQEKYAEDDNDDGYVEDISTFCKLYWFEVCLLPVYFLI